MERKGQTFRENPGSAGEQTIPSSPVSHKSRQILPLLKKGKLPIIAIFLLLILLGGSLLGLGLFARRGPLAKLGIGTSITTAPFSFHDDESVESMTSGPDGNLWFTLEIGEGATRKIGRLTPGGALTWFALPPDSRAEQITTGPDGNLWFAGQAYSASIGRITPTGSIREFSMPATLPDPLMPLTVSKGPDGNLWFLVPGDVGGAGPAVDFGYIGFISPGGSIREFALPHAYRYYLPLPPQLLLGPDGNLWFTASFDGKLVRFTPGGHLTEFALPRAACSSPRYTYVNGPAHMTIGPDGAIWFTETCAAQIGRITMQGHLTEFPTAQPAGSLWDLATGADGHLWFTDRQGTIDTFASFPPTGQLDKYALPRSDVPEDIMAGPDGKLWFSWYAPLEQVGGGIGHITPAPS